MKGAVDMLPPLILVMSYEKGMQQQEIAAKLGVSRMMVSRTLQRCREEGLVRIKIRLPFETDEALAEKLQRRYGLSEAVVVRSGRADRKAISEVLGQASAFHLGMMVRDGLILGLGLGATLGHLIQHLVPMATEGVHVVQLIGGLMDVAYTNPFTIVQEACTKLKAEGTYFAYPAIAENKEQRDSVFTNAPAGKKITQMWERCGTAVFGVGAVENGYLSSQLVTQEELRQQIQRGVVGDVLGHCFDKSGNFVVTDLADRLVSIPLELLRKVPVRMAVGGGPEKARALKALLSVGLVTTLFTDDSTATNILGGMQEAAVSRQR